MKKKILLALTLVMALIVSPFISTACAKPQLVSGSIVVIETGIPEFKQSGQSDNAILKFDFTEEWSGDIEGVGSGVTTWISHGIPFVTPGWTINTYEKLEFSAEIQGKTGTVVMQIVLFSDETGGSGHWTIQSGTGDLENLHGQGTISLSTIPYSYTGQVNFNP